MHRFQMNRKEIISPKSVCAYMYVFIRNEYNFYVTKSEFDFLCLPFVLALPKTK